MFGVNTIKEKIIFNLKKAVENSFGQDILAEDLTDFTINDYFTSILKQLAAKESEAKVTVFASAMYPISYPAAFESKVVDFLKQHPELPSSVRKTMLKRVEDSEKIRRARSTLFL